MSINTSESLEKCPKCRDLIEVWSKCLSCLYFKTNYPWMDISIAWDQVGASASDILRNDKKAVTTNTRLVNLKGQTEAILWLNIPWVRWTVTMKYRIKLHKCFSSSWDDFARIEDIELFFNRSISEEVRKLTRPFKWEIEQIIRKAFYWED